MLHFCMDYSTVWSYQENALIPIIPMVGSALETKMKAEAAKLKSGE